jgi:hypothetical protein
LPRVTGSSSIPIVVKKESGIDSVADASACSAGADDTAFDLGD